jgi:peptidoglycan/xylan/chitin deacetylase (PgdA/CDA1 family)
MHLSVYKDMMSSEMRLAAKVAFCCLLYYSGMVGFFRRFRKRDGGEIKILAYHDIGPQSFFNLQVPEKVFRSHMSYLSDAGYNVISLEEAVELLKSKKPVPADTVVITFDDGYRSIYEHVLPAVKKYGMPVTVFLSTGPVEKRGPLFVDALAYAFEKTKKERLDLTPWGLKEYPVVNPGLKERAGLEINDFSKDLKTEERRKLLQFIFEKLDVELDSPELKDRMLTWEEVRISKSQGVSFGAHTVSHPSLARISADEAREEIHRSKKMMEERLDSEIRTFAYPYGSAEDVDKKVRDIVSEKGFSCALTLQDGANSGGSDLFMLKRTCVTNQLKGPLQALSRAVFAVEMSGILGLLRGRRHA